MTAREAIEPFRHGWVAQWMGISESGLSRKLAGQRRWTEGEKRLFAQAICQPLEAIDFASEATEVVGQSSQSGDYGSAA